VSLSVSDAARPRVFGARDSVPGSPRPVLRLAAEGAPLTADTAGAAYIAGCAAATVEALQLHAGDDGSTDLVRGKLRAFLGLDRRRPCRRCRRDGAPVGQKCETCGAEGKNHAKSASKALNRAVGCGGSSLIFRERGRPDRRYQAPARCNARCCPECARRRLRRIIGGRWAALFAAVLRPGYVVDFFTIGNAADHGEGRGIVTKREHVRDYLRRSGQALRALREGRSRDGIEEGAIVAGLRVLELVPRRRNGRPCGAYAHLHIVLIRKAHVPYGLSEARLRERAARDPEWKPSPADRGIRAILRRMGLGEVGKHEVLTAEEGRATKNGIAPYLWKVQKYIEKVEKGQVRRDLGDGTFEVGESPLLFEGRHDVMTMLSGVRMVEPIGDARGLLGGPDRVVRELDGARCGPLELLGVFDPDDASTWDVLGPVHGPPRPATLHGDPSGPMDVEHREPGPLLLAAGEVVDHGRRLHVTRTTYYRVDTLERWREWADVDRLLSECITGQAQELGTQTQGQTGSRASAGPRVGPRRARKEHAGSAARARTVRRESAARA